MFIKTKRLTFRGPRAYGHRASVGALACLLAASFPVACAAQRIDFDHGPAAFAPYCVCFSPCGEKLVAAGGGSFVWDLRKKTPKPVSLDVPGFVCAASYSPEGKYLATLSVSLRDEEITGESSRDFLPPVVSLYDGKSGKLIRQFRGHETPKKGLWIMSLIWMPDGKRLATSGNKVILWDIESGRNIVEAPNLLGPLGVSSDGKSLITLGRRSQMSVYRWDIETSKETHLFSSDRQIYRMTVSPNGKWVAYSDDHSVRIRSMDGHTKYALPNRALAMAFSSDSESLAVGWHKTTVDIWSMKRREYVKRIPVSPHPTTISLAFSPDNERLARAGGTYMSDQAYAFTGHVMLLNARPGRVRDDE